MILVGLRLRIENFWASRISKEFPKTEFKILDIHPAKGFSRGILAVTGKHELEKIKEFLSILEGITKVEILLDESDIKLLSFYFQHGPLGEIIVRTGVHIRPPLILEEGTISVNLIGTTTSIQKLLNEIEELPDVSIEVTRKTKLKYIGKPQLTRIQEQILKAAIRLGYYDIPRKIRIEKLAVKLNRSPSTIAEHLRKAESRIIKDYF
jgi:predicted DNA binding protein